MWNTFKTFLYLTLHTFFWEIFIRTLKLSFFFFKLILKYYWNVNSFEKFMSVLNCPVYCFDIIYCVVIKLKLFYQIWKNFLLRDGSYGIWSFRSFCHGNDFTCQTNSTPPMQGTAGPDPTTVYVDMRALRHDR